MQARLAIPLVTVALAAVIGLGLSTRHHASNRHAAVRVVTTTSTSTTTTTTIPQPLSPLAPSAVAGEGVWTPAGQAVDGQVALYTTTLRPPSGGTPAGIARIDTTLARVVVFAGTTQPGGVWSAEGAVPATLASGLLAAFNGGFQFGSAEGGFYADGHADPALVDGAASLVVLSDGTASVAQWGRDASLTPDVVEVRQNLTLLVDAGAPTPAASSAGSWGATFGRVTATWRSAVGSDTARHLYWVGGPGLTPLDLAQLLVAAGATRGMEMDINPEWVFFVAYGGSGGTDLLAGMNFGPTHVLSPDWRDFVAVFTKPSSLSAVTP